jgi:hypothetical protein
MNAKALCVVLVPVVAVGGFCFWPSSHPAAVASPSLAKAAIIALAAASALSSHSGSAPVAEVVPTEAVDLQTALEQGSIKAEFKGNGRETLAAVIVNKTKSRLQVKVEVGQVLESGRGAVVIVRPSAIEIEPGQTAQASFQTAATRSSNHVEEATYVLTYNHVPRIELFLTYAQEHLELSPAAIQTAILALTENLPLSSVAKFNSASSELSSRFNTDAFRAETFDIISALAALKAMGIPDSAVAMTVDTQLRIEAMIDPLCRPTALRYYAITPENEWTYWKTELLSGNPTTRHYALYGIARFYPDIAIDMLPKWARETKTNAVLRLAAVQALADTHRPEVVNILKQLADDLGRETELGRAARGAALALDQRLGQMASAKTAAVNFRASQGLSEF